MINFPLFIEFLLIPYLGLLFLFYIKDLRKKRKLYKLPTQQLISK